MRSRNRLATVTLPCQIVREMISEKKAAPQLGHSLIFIVQRMDKKIQRLFFRGDCTHRANACASSAVDAYVRVDAVNITFLDCSGRAFTLTCAACYAVGLRNFVSHFQYPLKLLLLSAFPLHFCQGCAKISNPFQKIKVWSDICKSWTKEKKATLHTN